MSDVKLFLGDAYRLIEGVDSRKFILIADPPYGLGVRTNYKERGRGKLAECNDFPLIHGDDKPFDPSPFLKFHTVVLFGANYYADKLPPSSGWVIWDKLNGLTSNRDWGFNDNADCELIWTNSQQPARLIKHRWLGAMKESEKSERRVHPTQKPIALMIQLVEQFSDVGDTVIDPFMGSGTTGIACVKTGRNFIGYEIDPYNFDLAQRRILEAQADMGLADKIVNETTIQARIL